MKPRVLIIAALAAMCLTATAKPKVIAHACWWNSEAGGGAMNSLQAFKNAIDSKVWGVEFDVNYTKDGKIAVYHNNGYNGRCVNDITFEEMSDCVLKNGERVPLADSLFAYAAPRPGVVLVIEIKFCKTMALEREFVDALLGALKAYGLYDPSRVRFVSFSANVCKYLVEKAPEFNTEYVIYNGPASKVKSLGVAGVDVEQNAVKNIPGYVDSYHKLGLEVNVWTSDSKADLKKVISTRPDYVTTNDPALAMRLIGKY